MSVRGQFLLGIILFIICQLFIHDDIVGVDLKFF